MLAYIVSIFAAGLVIFVEYSRIEWLNQAI